jgi:Integrase zinc binding domain
VGETTLTSLEAEKKAHQPYSSSLTEPKIFSPDDKEILGLVAMLSDLEIKPAIPLTLAISADKDFLTLLHKGYEEDKWTRSLTLANPSLQSLTTQDGHWFLDRRLIIPDFRHLWETLFRLAHDNLGHFGFDKTYESLQNSYYWPRMQRDLESMYVPSCMECQHNQSSTTNPIGPLHPLPIPDGRGDSVAMDFIRPLPMDEGLDCILTLTDWLGSNVRIVLCTTSLIAEDLTTLLHELVL